MEIETIEKPKCYGKECLPLIHDMLIASHWQFKGQSCGCSGSAKKRTYIRNGETIIINLKKNTFTKNSVNEKPIEEVSITDYI